MASAKIPQTAETAQDEVVNTVVDDDANVAVRRYFTIPGRDPFEEVEWEIRDALIPGKDKPVFEQKGVEFPKFWSQTATNIVAQKYFRGRMGSPDRESSVKQMIGRVVTTVGAWGREGGYFADEEEAETFEAELKAILVNQYAAFNSPVWFNVGFEEKPQCSRVLHPLDRGLDGLDPRLDPPRGRHLPRRLGLGRQPLEAALVEGAALEGRLRLRPGQLHARRRRVRRHDQVGRQDAARGQDGRPRHRPPGHRRVHLVQVEGGGEGARPRGGGLRHVARLERLGLDPVPEREQLGARHRRVHGGGRGGRRLEPDRAHRRDGRRDDPGAGSCCATWPRRRGGAPTRASSTTRRSTSGTRCRTRAASTRRTRAPSTCRSTTGRATSPRSTS